MGMCDKERLIEFSNRSGHRLRGMIHETDASEGRSAPGAVFYHGFTGDRMESHWIFVKCSRALARVGISSLRFDFFGSGESDGQFREASIDSEIADAEDAAEFFRREGGIGRDRLGLVGLSLGGAIAALVAERIQARALVLWAAVARLPHLRALADTFARPLSGSDGAHEYAGHIISERFLEAVDRLDPLEGVARFDHPTLIVHPERDEYLDLSHPEDYFRASTAAVKDKVIVRGADHTFTSVGWENQVISRTVDWLRDYL